MIGLWDIDMVTEVSMLSLHMALPCQQHLLAATHLMLHFLCTIIPDNIWNLYIKTRKLTNSWYVCGLNFTCCGKAYFTKCSRTSWKKQRFVVDSDYTGVECTNQDRTIFIVCVNTSLISWYSRQQFTIDHWKIYLWCRVCYNEDWFETLRILGWNYVL